MCVLKKNKVINPTPASRWGRINKCDVLSSVHQRIGAWQAEFQHQQHCTIITRHRNEPSTVTCEKKKKKKLQLSFVMLTCLVWLKQVQKEIQFFHHVILFSSSLYLKKKKKRKWNEMEGMGADRKKSFWFRILLNISTGYFLCASSAFYLLHGFVSKQAKLHWQAFDRLSEGSPRALWRREGRQRSAVCAQSTKTEKQTTRWNLQDDWSDMRQRKHISGDTEALRKVHNNHEQGISSVALLRFSSTLPHFS